MKLGDFEFEEVTLDICGFIKDIENFPKNSGIYFVYIVYNQGGNIKYRLIYIGESYDMYGRHHPHDKYEEFQDAAKSHNGFVLYSYALVPNHYQREEIEAALIREIKPVLNSVSAEGYTGKPYIISICGNTTSLNDEYIILPDSKSHY